MHAWRLRTGSVVLLCDSSSVTRPRPRLHTKFSILVWCPKLESRGISLEKVSYRNSGVHHTKQGCFGRLALRAACCTRNIFKKPCTFWEIDIFTCFGAVLYEGSMEGVWLENADLWSTISISGRLVTGRGNFLKKRKGLITYYSLFGQLASRRVRRI